MLNLLFSSILLYMYLYRLQNAKKISSNFISYDVFDINENNKST